MSDLDPVDGSDDDELGFDGANHLVGLLQEITDEDRHRIEPPSSVWNAILDTVTADRDGRPDRTLTLTDNGNGSVVADISPIEQQATTTIALATPRRRSSDQPLFPAEAGVGRRHWLPVAAAVAVTVVGGLVTWAFSDELPGAGGGPATTAELEGDVVAVAEISADGLPAGAAGEGEARLLRVRDLYVLDLDVPDLPAVEGYYELWIADPAVDGVVSLGPVSGDGRYSLPANVDPVDYPVVDVSVESVDGDPTHSGRSAWRGAFDL